MMMDDDNGTFGQSMMSPTSNKMGFGPTPGGFGGQNVAASMDFSNKGHKPASSMANELLIGNRG